jgi:hypothetical protein
MFLGNVVIICCIGPNNSSEYSYDMMARSQKCKLKLQSFAKNITQFTLATLSSGFLVIPFSSSRLIKLEICIKPVPMVPPISFSLLCFFALLLVSVSIFLFLDQFLKYQSQMFFLLMI